MNACAMAGTSAPAAAGSRRQPLEGLLVLDMSQFLSGPSAALKLLDMGARVIKIERPQGGDICRRLYLTDTDIGGDSTLFHAINRGKESVAADLKSPQDMAVVHALIRQADVLIHNFRPGVIQRLGLGFDDVAVLNPRLVYAGISGYGETGPWVGVPGQDLLAQAVSGVMWLNGDQGQGPVPFGLAIADMLAGHLLTQGILAALVQRGITGKGAWVQTSLLEALLDFQFEVLTTHLNDGGRLPQRAAQGNAHAYLAAPYGVYPTQDGYLALAMMPLAELAQSLDLPALQSYAQTPGSEFSQRDDIRRLIAAHTRQRTTAQWLDVLRPADVWCAEVLDWPALLSQQAFQELGMLQQVRSADGTTLRTTRSPLRFDGQRLGASMAAAPAIGQHTQDVMAEFLPAQPGA